jgi:glycosyltransferase involved in cell wall biosynthesis
MKSIWITWQDHRRSRELAQALNIPYYSFFSKTKGLARYIILGWQTIWLVSQKRPSIIFCQNPSIVLATILCFLKKIKNCRVVVDRHTNFKFNTEKSLNPKWLIFHLLSDFTLKNADITIVTNSPLAKIVLERGGNPFVLQDKLPDLTKPKVLPKLKGKFNFLFICSYSADEPVDIVLETFKLLPPDYQIYITGDYTQYKNAKNFYNYININFLGYIPENDYISYLFACDAIIILTTSPMTLNCGSYEAIAANKYQIVSDTDAIRDYFKNGCEYVKIFDIHNVKISIMNTERRLLKGTEHEIEQIKSEITADWQERFTNLQEKIKSY